MKYTQYCMHDQIWKESWWLDIIWIKFAWKDWKIYAWKIKYPLHQFIDPLDKKTYPNHSHINTDANPNVQGLPAAQELHNQTWVFWQKFQNWKLGYSAIQGQILIPLCSWSFKEGVWIKTISSNTKKRENNRVLYRIFFTFLHHDSCVFYSF